MFDLGDTFDTGMNVMTLGAWDGLDISGKNATGKALSAQTQGTNQANSVLANTFDVQQKEIEPWKNAGMSGLAGLQNNDFMNNWQQDPGYQFQLNEGNKAINAAAAARGIANSSGTMKSLLRYGQDYASNAYDKAYNREYSRLSQLAGFGQNAMNTAVEATGNYGQNVSNNYMGLANANASAHIAQGNRMSNMIGQVSGAVAAKYCDERLKTNIKPVPKDVIDELKKDLKAFYFEYKDKIHGAGQHIGVMAQDLEKSRLGKEVVFEDEQGNKKIDLSKVLSIFLATMAEA